jgi:hypothetical protein
MISQNFSLLRRKRGESHSKYKVIYVSRRTRHGLPRVNLLRQHRRIQNKRQTNRPCPRKHGVNARRRIRLLLMLHLKQMHQPSLTLQRRSRNGRIQQNFCVDSRAHLQSCHKHSPLTIEVGLRQPKLGLILGSPHYQLLLYS